jgi:mono/diheme cytochrome c family protein
MNKIKSILVAGLGLTIGLVSCDSGNIRRTPGHIYAPDMTYSRAYDAYTANPNFADGMSSRLPVSGTVARGHQLPDHLVEGDTSAYKTFTTSLRFNDAEMKEGGRLFNIYCGICHGTNLDGNGPLYASGKFASMPANFKDGKYLHMPVGQMYAAVKYGKNMMGSYASQLDIKQRWMVIAYIKKVQSSNGGDAFAYGETATAVTAPAADTAKGMKPVASAATPNKEKK